MNFIVTQLNGGLGNQLFQYAAGRALALKKQVSLKLDLHQVEQDPIRNFELDKFQIQAEVLTDSERQQFLGKTDSRFLSAGKRRINRWRQKLYLEPHYHFDSNFWKLTPPVYLQGYWQSPRYFYNIDGQLRTEFQLKDSFSAPSLEIAARINQATSVSLHVRRGDYLQNPQVNAVHGLCALDYYQKAVEIISAQISNPVFFVFSDDLAWCQQNLDFLPQVYFVNNKQNSPQEDLYLMSFCQHHILANSSFSWWGAWLNPRVNKIVLRPQQWFRNSKLNSKDLCPTRWQGVYSKPKLN